MNNYINYIDSAKFIKLSPENEKLAKLHYKNIIYELMALDTIVYFLKEELNTLTSENQDIKTEKCHYHIDNFFQRYYLFEENIFNFLGTIFQFEPKIKMYELMIGNKSKERKSMIRDLLKSEYADVSDIAEKFFANSDIKELKDGRTKIVHKAGSKMNQYLMYIGVPNESTKNNSQDAEENKIKHIVISVGKEEALKN